MPRQQLRAPRSYSNGTCVVSSSCVLFSDRVNSKKRETIVGRVRALLAGDPELKEAAKRAVVAYLRSLHLASNKRLFRVEQLDMAAFAECVSEAKHSRLFVFGYCVHL